MSVTLMKKIDFDNDTIENIRCWIPNPRVPPSKPLGGSKINSGFYPSEIDQMSTNNFWELSGKVNCLLVVAL